MLDGRRIQHLSIPIQRVVWLNPEPPGEWKRYETIRLVERIFPMFHLSVDGLSDAVSALIGARVSH